jgi:hypothetical protein
MKNTKQRKKEVGKDLLKRKIKHRKSLKNYQEAV